MLNLRESLSRIGTAMMHDSDEFVADVGQSLFEVAQEHDVWTGSCARTAAHWDDAIPCDEFERGLALALSWLGSRTGVDLTTPAAEANEAPVADATSEPADGEAIAPTVELEPRRRPGRKVTPPDEGA